MKRLVAVLVLVVALVPVLSGVASAGTFSVTPVCGVSNVSSPLVAGGSFTGSIQCSGLGGLVTSASPGVSMTSTSAGWMVFVPSLSWPAGDETALSVYNLSSSDWPSTLDITVSPDNPACSENGYSGTVSSGEFCVVPTTVSGNQSPDYFTFVDVYQSADFQYGYSSSDVSGSSFDAPPCTVSVLTGPPLMNEPKAYYFTGNVSVGSAGLFAVPANSPAFSSAGPPSNWLSESVNGTATSGFYHMLDTQGDTWGFTIDYTDSTSVTSTAPGLELWCVYFPGGLNQSNSNGTWVDEGPLIGSGGLLGSSGPSNPAPPLSQSARPTGAGCLASSGLGLSPASWLPAVFNASVCLFEWVFVPSQSSLSAIENQFGVSSNSPVVGASSASQWLGNIGYMLTVGPAAGAEAIQNAEASGATSSLVDVGPSVTVGSRVFTVNVPLIVSAISSAGSSTWLPVLLLVLTSLLLVMFFILVATWLRRVLGSKE